MLNDLNAMEGSVLVPLVMCLSQVNWTKLLTETSSLCSQHSGTHEHALILGTFQSLCLTLAPLEALFEQGASPCIPYFHRCYTTNGICISQPLSVCETGANRAQFRAAVDTELSGACRISIFPVVNCNNPLTPWDPKSQSLNRSTLVLSDLMFWFFQFEHC